MISFFLSFFLPARSIMNIMPGSVKALIGGLVPDAYL